MFIPPLVLRLGFRTKLELRNMPQTEGAYEQFEAMEDPEAEEKSVEVDIEDLRSNGEEKVYVLMTDNLPFEEVSQRRAVVGLHSFGVWGCVAPMGGYKTH